MFNLIPLPYKILIAIAALFLVGGVSYFNGYSSAKNKAKSELADKNLAIEKLKVSLAESSNKVTVQYVDRWNVIREKEVNNVQAATNSVPAQYNLSSGWVYTHDAAAKSDYADPARASNETPSDVKDNQALAVVVSNYAVCAQNQNQLISLQQWILDQQATINKKSSK